jgi:hypothetical protein
LSEELDMSLTGKLEDGVRQTIAIWVENARTGAAMEIGQTEDRKIYFQRQIPGLSRDKNKNKGKA